MVGLDTRYLGLDLPSPLVASASPLTGSLDGLRRLEDAGAGAVVLPSLFEEQLTLEADQVRRLLDAGADSLSKALTLDDDNAGPHGYLALLEEAGADASQPPPGLTPTGRLPEELPEGHGAPRTAAPNRQRGCPARLG